MSHLGYRTLVILHLVSHIKNMILSNQTMDMVVIYTAAKVATIAVMTLPPIEVNNTFASRLKWKHLLSYSPDQLGFLFFVCTPTCWFFLSYPKAGTFF